MNKSWQDELQLAIGNKHPKPLAQLAAFSASANRLFPAVITQQMLQQIDHSDETDPVLAQFLPVAEENTVSVGYHEDPVGDMPATQVPGLIHKYHGRVLLIASGSCAVNCRYCFRRHFPYGQSYAPRNHWQKSIDYISSDSSIYEVILSGGDPLTLDTKTLHKLTSQLARLTHVKTLRIHSRIPVVLSSRIDDSFLQWAQALPLKKVMVLHINHSKELNQAARQAITKLAAAGFVLLNQTVLLKGVNDTLSDLRDLSHTLFDAGVLPYYLHQMDPVQHAAHFTVDTAKALDLHRQLQAVLPGYLTPKFVQEIAGEKHKTLLR